MYFGGVLRLLAYVSGVLQVRVWTPGSVGAGEFPGGIVQAFRPSSVISGRMLIYLFVWQLINII